MVKHGLNLPDEHLIALGHVAVRSAHMEHLIEYAIDTLMSHSPHTAKYTLKRANSNELPKILAAAMLDQWGSIAESDAKEISEQIAQARLNRNTLLHHIWGREETSDTIIAASFRPYRDGTRRSWTTNEIHAVANELQEVSKKLSRLFGRGIAQQAGNRRPASPYTPLAQSQQYGLLGSPEEDRED